MAPIGTPTWAAASGYARNLLDAVEAHTSDRLEVVVLPAVAPTRLRRGARRVSGVDAPHTWAGWSRRLDALLLPVPQGRIVGSRLLAWIPDLQHRVLPDMFDEATSRMRDRSYLRAAEVADWIVVPSRQVEEEFSRFAPAAADRVVALHPVRAVDASTFDRDPRDVAATYQLPEAFVYCPGQFWRHKDHGTLFRAVGRAAAQGAEVQVVTSGLEEDYRHPGHAAALRKLVIDLGVEDRITLLGPIPYDDVIQLMRASVAVVNPSRYEGFGMTVDEARAVGARLILSDIPAHHEHEVEARFFPPGDVAVLADLLSTAMDRGPETNRARERDASAGSTRLQRRYAERLLALVDPGSAASPT